MATTIKAPGIYQIRNLLNGKIYVGSSVNLNTRRIRHFRDLRGGFHFNSHLQRAFNKYGPDAFVFEVIEYCESSKLIEREQFWIDYKKTSHTLYNSSPTAGNQLGIKRTDETKKKMSAAQKGHKTSDEARQNGLRRIRNQNEELNRIQ